MMTARSEEEPQADPDVSDAALERFLGYRMKRAFNVIRADLTETLKPFGLRVTSYTALVLIKENPGLSQSQLAAVMDIERPNLVMIVDALERRELITRNRLETDRRTYALDVTSCGRRLCDQAMSAAERHEEVLLKALSQEMKDTVAEAMTLIRRQGGRR